MGLRKKPAAPDGSIVIMKPNPWYNALVDPCDTSSTMLALLTSPYEKKRLFEKVDTMLFMASDKTRIASIVFLRIITPSIP